MSDSSTTRFVPSSEEYTAPERPIDRIRAITARMPRVDANGRDLPRGEADPTVTEIVDPAAPAAPAAMLPNAAQGGGGTSIAAPATGLTTTERVAAELARKLAPPLPAGYVPR